MVSVGPGVYVGGLNPDIQGSLLRRLQRLRQIVSVGSAPSESSDHVASNLPVAQPAKDAFWAPEGTTPSLESAAEFPKRHE